MAKEPWSEYIDKAAEIKIDNGFYAAIDFLNDANYYGMVDDFFAHSNGEELGWKLYTLIMFFADNGFTKDETSKVFKYVLNVTPKQSWIDYINSVYSRRKELEFKTLMKNIDNSNSPSFYDDPLA